MLFKQFRVSFFGEYDALFQIDRHGLLHKLCNGQMFHIRMILFGRIFPSFVEFKMKFTCPVQWIFVDWMCVDYLIIEWIVNTRHTFHWYARNWFEFRNAKYLIRATFFPASVNALSMNPELILSAVFIYFVGFFGHYRNNSKIILFKLILHHKLCEMSEL